VRDGKLRTMTGLSSASLREAFDSHKYFGLVKIAGRQCGAANYQLVTQEMRKLTRLIGQFKTSLLPST
jgi:hypothetical protein